MYHCTTVCFISIDAAEEIEKVTDDFYDQLEKYASLAEKAVASTPSLRNCTPPDTDTTRGISGIIEHALMTIFRFSVLMKYFQINHTLNWKVVPRQ